MDDYKWSYVGSFNTDWDELKILYHWTEQERSALRSFIQTRCKNAARIGWLNQTTKTFPYSRPGTTETVHVRVLATVQRNPDVNHWLFSVQSAKGE